MNENGKIDMASERGTWRRARGALEAGLLLLIVAAPLLAAAQGGAFWLDLATRTAILAIAAVGLNLMLGLAGLASLGHAAYLAIGAYAVAIPAHHAIYGGAPWLASENGLFHLALALIAGGAFALLTGLLALRTKGVHFIMLTMAFAQMLYFLLQGLEQYGGDDGMSLDVRSQLPLLNLDIPWQMHLLAATTLLAALGLWRFIATRRFGLALAGCRQNARRMTALGWPVRHLLLGAYVLGSLLAVLAGVLMANHAAFVSPAITEWTRSGDLLFMVIAGGAGRLLGPITGAALFVLLEAVLSAFTLYWHLPFGLLMLALALWQASAPRKTRPWS